MKKIKITQFICLAFLTFFGLQVNAQCPSGETEVTVTYSSGIFDGENAWSLWDATASVELACYATNTFGNSTQSACVTHGNSIELRAWESFGDNWNGATVAVATSDDGSANTCPADMNNLYGPNGNPGGADGNGSYFCTSTPQNGALAFSFSIPACGAPPTGGGGGNACAVLCPADITVTTDPYAGQNDCNAWIDIDPLEVTGDCDLMTIVNDYNGGTNASDHYPLGTTTVTYTIITLDGDLIGCQFDVTVEDNTPPVFVECPGDMTVNLDAGECAAVLDFNIIALDECTPAPGGDFIPGAPLEITNNNVFSEAS